jgi:hypothetical protein
MKKSKFISLVLISASLASCNKQKDDDWSGSSNSHVYMRSDSTAGYSRYHGGGGLWYYAFRPYGAFRNGSYKRGGYYSSGISHNSNIGSNSFKGTVTRGGFGGHGGSIHS